MAQKRNSHAYAQALLEMATEPLLKGLRTVTRRLRDNGVLEQLTNPTLSAEDKNTLLTPLLHDLPPQVVSLVRTLVSVGDITKLDSVCDEFESLVARRTRYVLAHVTSAVELTTEERRTLEKQLARRFGGELEAEYEVDPALIGGVVVRVGDEVIDGSLAGKLAALREQLG